MSGPDSVDVPSQVQVELGHRDHLAIAATSRTAFDAKGGALTGLADDGDHALAQVRTQSLTKADRGCGLAFAERRGRDASHHDCAAGGEMPEEEGQRSAAQRSSSVAPEPRRTAVAQGTP